MAYLRSNHAFLHTKFTQKTIHFKFLGTRPLGGARGGGEGWRGANREPATCSRPNQNFIRPSCPSLDNQAADLSADGGAGGGVAGVADDDLEARRGGEAG